MQQMNIWAVVTAVIAGFVVANVYYMVTAKPLAAAGSNVDTEGRPPAWKVGIELLRLVVLTVVVAKLTVATGADGWWAGVKLALGLWIGFPAILLSGSMIWENVPWRVALIHAGDWLLKLLLITIVVASWR
ncbi:DUF1761 domain-containing protein [Nocardia yamanashiensis]|uniref:DUF1761 domain-containing protein n=1 Tax=Nocardia yamanashiensis TaxID=209247 RepID=UPI00082B8A81|nr:DUF1761 domain-containing protein [Nocardia yamanashiensis]